MINWGKIIETIFQLFAFIVLSYLLLGDIKQAIGLGWLIFIICSRLEEIAENLES